MSDFQEIWHRIFSSGTFIRRLDERSANYVVCETFVSGVIRQCRHSYAAVSMSPVRVNQASPREVALLSTQITRKWLQFGRQTSIVQFQRSISDRENAWSLLQRCSFLPSSVESSQKQHTLPAGRRADSCPRCDDVSAGCSRAM